MGLPMRWPFGLVRPRDAAPSLLDGKDTGLTSFAVVERLSFRWKDESVALNLQIEIPHPVGCASRFPDLSPRFCSLFRAKTETSRRFLSE